MADKFFEHPILNSPYEEPSLHWELDELGQPTQNILEYRRPAEFISPIPKPQKRKNLTPDLFQDLEARRISTENQQYDLIETINSLRKELKAWRQSEPEKWQVTPETARLLKHWRTHQFSGLRPFFCQIEAAEAIIWLTEVAPKIGKKGENFLSHLKTANKEANPDLFRLALKLATGAGKTTVMAMLIAWQTINAVRYQQSSRFTKGFLVVAPGLTIKDRLRVLLPTDPESYYARRELVPGDLLRDLSQARIVITNYHAFKLRTRLELSKGTRDLLAGSIGEAPDVLETEGQMIQRVMPELMGLKSIMVLNDEAHHCYRAKEKVTNETDFDDLSGDEKREARSEADKNNEAARLWISGLEAVKRKIGITEVIDLSATPFFLRGSGFNEGTLFHWTVSDFSLMDAIECGIVKLPRVPVAQNIPGGEMPMYRNFVGAYSQRYAKKGLG